MAKNDLYRYRRKGATHPKHGVGYGSSKNIRINRKRHNTKNKIRQKGGIL